MFDYRSKLYPLISLCGAVSFACIISPLQCLSGGATQCYELGRVLLQAPHGWQLPTAFVALALALISLGVALLAHNVWQMLLAPLFMAAFCFMAAGFIHLTYAIATHHMLIGSALICCVLSMGMLPHSLPEQTLRYPRLCSWGMCAIVVAGSTQGLFPDGMGIQYATVALLAWIGMIAAQLLLRKHPA